MYTIRLVADGVLTSNYRFLSLNFQAKLWLPMKYVLTLKSTWFKTIVL